MACLRTFTRSPVLRTALGEILRVREPDDVSADVALRIALAWVTRAQDACADGAVSAGFRVVRGWRCGDLEATAAAIPLLVTESAESGSRSLRARAHRAAAAIPALLGASEAWGAPAVAIALSAAAAWAPHAASARRDEAITRVARLADELLAALERASGANDTVDRWTLAASAAAALCAAARCVGEPRFAVRAEELLDDVADAEPVREVTTELARRPAERQPLIRGVAALPSLLRDLRDAAVALGRADLVLLAVSEGETLLRRFELRRRIAIGLPRVLRARDARPFSPVAWSGAALFWIEEFERTGDPRPLNAALGVLDALTGVQRHRPGVVDVHGAIPWSVPAKPRLTAPIFDGLAAVRLACALVARRRALRAFDELVTRGQATQTRDVPRALPPPSPTPGSLAPRVVLYASPFIHRAPRMLEQWRAWGFAPAAIVMERRPLPPLAQRIRHRLANDGVREAVRRAVRRMVGAPTTSPEESTIDYCARRGIRIVDVGALDEPETVEAVRALSPDLAIHVGTGILRAPLLAVPRLGTLNIHNGVLPALRGINVVEWARLLGRSVACTVHLIDPGVDTGDILLVREVGVQNAQSIEELRARVNRAQPGILGAVVQWIVQSGGLPPRRAQRTDDGRQFFAMHDTLRRMLARRLAAPADTSAQPSPVAPFVNAQR